MRGFSFQSSKLRATLGILLGFCLLTFPHAASADEITPSRAVASDKAKLLEPISDWNIDYGEQRCRLTRLFGDQDNRHLLDIKQIAPQSSFTITFAGPLLGDWQRKRGIEIGLRDTEPFEEIGWKNYGQVRQFGPLIMVKTKLREASQTESTPRYAGIDDSLAAEVNRIVLQKNGDFLSFETGGMRDAFAALNACTHDLLKRWGLDPEKHKAHTPVSLPDAAKFHGRIIDGIPRRAIRRAASRNYDWLIVVDEFGTAKECTGVDNGENEEFEQAACKSIMKLSFNPARDSDGEAMASFTTIHVSLGSSTL